MACKAQLENKGNTSVRFTEDYEARIGMTTYVPGLYLTYFLSLVMRFT